MSSTAITPRGQKTATRILDVAEQLFAEKGFAGTSLRDIASAAGIQKASLYNHFASKDELYNAVLQRGFDPMLSIMNDFVERGETAYENPRLLDAVFDILGDRPNFARLLQFECLQGGEKLKSLMQAWIRAGLAQGERAMKGSIHGKHWRDEELHQLIFYTFSMILSYFTLAPLYELYTEEPHGTAASKARQKQFLSKLWRHIWYVSGD